MSKKTTLRITLPDGTTANRTTTHAYKFVIAGRLDLTQKRAEAAEDHPSDLTNFSWDQKLVSTGAGNKYTYPSGVPISISEQDVEHAHQRLAGCTSAQDYIRKCISERIDIVNQRYGNEDMGPWVVLRWSGSAATAQRALNKYRPWGYTALTILPISQPE